jgi:hypothetical protein
MKRRFKKLSISGTFLSLTTNNSNANVKLVCSLHIPHDVASGGDISAVFSLFVTWYVNFSVRSAKVKRLACQKHYNKQAIHLRRRCSIDACHILRHRHRSIAVARCPPVITCYAAEWVVVVTRNTVYDIHKAWSRVSENKIVSQPRPGLRHEKTGWFLGSDDSVRVALAGSISPFLLGRSRLQVKMSLLLLSIYYTALPPANNYLECLAPEEVYCWTFLETSDLCCR